MLDINLCKNINFFMLFFEEKIQKYMNILFLICKVSKIFVRMCDLDIIIKGIDINLDGEINFL